MLSLYVTTFRITCDIHNTNEGEQHDRDGVEHRTDTVCKKNQANDCKDERRSEILTNEWDQRLKLQTKMGKVSCFLVQNRDVITH